MTPRSGYVKRSLSKYVLYGRIRPVLQEKPHNLDMALKRRPV